MFLQLVTIDMAADITLESQSFSYEDVIDSYITASVSSPHHSYFNYVVLF